MKKKQRIVLLSLVFPPDGVSTAHLMGELAKGLRDRGHSLIVLTSTPHYNEDAAAEVSQPRKRILGPLLQSSSFHGCPVYHVWMPRRSRNPFARILAWGWFHLGTLLVGFSVARGIDVVITPSPPLSNGIIAGLLSWKGGGRYIYNVQEVYPDVAISTGVLRNPWLIALSRRLESYVYTRAAAVTVIGSRMKATIQDRVGHTPVALIANAVDCSQATILPKDNSFARTYDLVDKFVVTYAGNMGVAQRLDDLLAVAEKVRSEPRIRFLLVGGGSEIDRLREIVGFRGLENTLILSYQPRETVPEIYGASDVCFVPLADALAKQAAPSKVYQILASQRPVLAYTTSDSDLADVVRESGGGIVASSVGDLEAAIYQFMNEQDEWRARAPEIATWIRERFDLSTSVDAYERLIDSLIGTRSVESWQSTPEAARAPGGTQAANEWKQ